MGENTIRIKWINIKARQLNHSQTISDEKLWKISFSIFIDNFWHEKIPIKARIEIRKDDAGFKIMEENMVLDAQESNHFNIHEEVTNPDEWTTETRHLYDVTITIYNALGESVDANTSQMGFVGEEPLISKQNPIVYYHESQAQMYEDIMCMKRLNIHRIYYCAWDKQEEFYHLCDIYGIKIIDVLPYVEISPQSIYQIEEYYGLYANHPSVERWIVAPIMKKSDYYLVKEITSKNRVDIGEYFDQHTLYWARGFRKSREYEASGLPQIPDTGWLFNSLNQSRPIARVVKKENQAFSFKLSDQRDHVIIRNHYIYKGSKAFLFGYELLENGISIFKEVKESFDIAAGEQGTIKLKFDGVDFNAACQYDVNVFATLSEKTDYEEAGYILAMDQLRLQESHKVLEIIAPDLPVRVQEKHRKIFLEGERLSCNISRQNGELLNLAVGVKEIFLKPLQIECFMGDEGKLCSLRLKGYTYQTIDNGSQVVCSYKIKGHKGLINLIYTFNGKNALLIELSVSEMVEIESTRLMIRLNNPGDHITYFGKGPDDNTQQYNEGAYLGVFDIDQHQVDIERCQVSWMRIGEIELETVHESVCNYRIVKDVNQFVDIEVEFIGETAILKIEV